MSEASTGRTYPPKGGNPPEFSLDSLDEGSFSKISEYLGVKCNANLFCANKKIAAMEIKKVALKKKEVRYSHRYTSNNTLFLRCKEIQKSNNYKNGCNYHGFRVGHQVQVIYDNDNDYWRGRYKDSTLVGKYGYVVGVTPQFV